LLDPEDVKILSLGAIGNFGKGTGLSWAGIRLWATKGPSIRPRCIGTVRARTQCKSISQLAVNAEVIEGKLPLHIQAVHYWTAHS
jgi:hypothetical protein